MDIRLLRGILNRTTFRILNPLLSPEILAGTTMAVVAWIRAYWKSNPNVEEITPKELEEYVTVRNSEKLEDESVQLTLELVRKLQHTPKPEAASLYETLLEAQCAGELGRVVLQYQTGAEVDVISEAMEISREYATLKGLEEDTPSGIYEILEAMEDNVGIAFPGVPLFEDYSTPLTPGESVLFAGRPDRGKTTWLSYLIPKAVPSIMQHYGEEHGVLWLVNEGHVDKILPRIYQGALGCTLTEMYSKMHEGTLIQEFEEVIQAPHDIIKVRPFHGKTLSDLELMVQKHEPSLVVIDMVEHVGGALGGSKTEVIGNLWERMRTLALMYEYVSIGTAQISVEGADNLFPTYEHLAYSKTAVQGYTDRVMMMGNIEREGMEHIRGLSLPKNKGKVQGKTSYPRMEYTVDFDRCQFYPLQDRSD